MLQFPTFHSLKFVYDLQASQEWYEYKRAVRVTVSAVALLICKVHLPAFWLQCQSGSPCARVVLPFRYMTFDGNNQNLYRASIFKVTPVQKALLFKDLHKCHNYVTINAAIYISYKMLCHNFSPLVWRREEMRKWDKHLADKKRKWDLWVGILVNVSHFLITLLGSRCDYCHFTNCDWN